MDPYRVRGIEELIVGFYGQTNKWTHDHSLAVLNRGKIHTFVQLERITRKKFDNRLPDHLCQILEGVRISLEEIESHILGYANTFSLEPGEFFKKATNHIRNSSGSIEFQPEPSADFEPIKTRGRINDHPVTAQVVPHEIAHLFSHIPFFGMFREDSLLIHVDGAASICNASAWHYNQGQLTLLEKSSEFHHALLNYSYNDLMFEILDLEKQNHLGMPGRLMGYASYGKSTAQLLEWLQSRDFFLEYSKYPREQFLREASKLFLFAENRICQKHQFSFDIAASIQKHFEDKILSFILKHQRETNAKHLYYAGGAALNIKLNARLVNSRIFQKVFIPPPANDSGLALGVVCFLAWKEKQKIRLHDVFLNNYGSNEYSYDPTFSVDEVCKDLANGFVTGIWVGFGEAGPRALGHRSILAHPGKKGMQEYVSRQLKGREWYRPLAPIVLESELDTIFEDYIPSPLMYFMLYEFKVKEKMKKDISAVVHVDGTARAQVVRSDDKALRLVAEILTNMSNQHNIPCLINTSFNMAGEPIVHTKKDALISARKMGLDRLVLGNEYICLR